MEAEILSDGWVRYFDENSKCFYFFNESTGTTQWDEPPSIKTANLTSDPISQTDAENTLCDQASLPAYMQTDFSKLGHNVDALYFTFYDVNLGRLSIHAIPGGFCHHHSVSCDLHRQPSQLPFFEAKATPTPTLF